MLDLGGACELFFDSLCDTLFMHHVYLFALCGILCLMVVRHDMCATLLYSSMSCVLAHIVFASAFLL